MVGFTLNGTSYYYVKNLQGDVIGILDSTGMLVVQYTYDAWGKLLSITDGNGTAITNTSHVAYRNPIRYRGYVYDEEIGMYYLQSRYYDPNTGRFINQDMAEIILEDQGFLGQHNLYAYCGNNPVNQQDNNGYIAANIIGAAIGAIIGAVGGVFLGNWLADILKLSGWKRWVFVGAVSVLVGAAAATIGYFIGPYVAKIATKLGNYIANLVRKGKIAFKTLSSNAKSSLRTLFKETCCFVAGTQIFTSTGEVNIEKIAVGDSVYAENPATGEIGIKKVSATFIKETNTLYHIFTEDEEIVTTNEHPFWVSGIGWVAACDLCPGDNLFVHDKKMVSVTNVFVEILDIPVTVYNFEVEDWHTYFVGADKILVHNKCSLTKIQDSFLKKNGLDAHSIKHEVLGTNAKVSRYNLYYDKSTGAIFILANGAKEAAKIATGYFIK